MDQRASALKWWIDAGVDTIVGEAPRDWLAAPAPAATTPSRAAEPEPEPELVLPAASAAPPPDTLEAFLEWLESADLGFAPISKRVMPAGDPTAGLMILVDMPSLADAEAGRLLTGEAGALFDRMIAATGRDRAAAWIAPLAPARTATGRIDAASAERLKAILDHHLGLVRPRVLLVFGDECAKALFGAPVAQLRGKWHEFHAESGVVRALVTLRPEKLLAQPGLKKLAWDDLKMLIEELKP